MLFPHPKPTIGRKKKSWCLIMADKASRSLVPLLPPVHLPFTPPFASLLPLKPLSTFQPQELYLTFCLWNFIPAGTLISGSLSSFRPQTSLLQGPSLPIPSRVIPTPACLLSPSFRDFSTSPVSLWNDLVFFFPPRLPVSAEQEPVHLLLCPMHTPKMTCVSEWLSTWARILSWALTKNKAWFLPKGFSGAENGGLSEGRPCNLSSSWSTSRSHRAQLIRWGREA